MVVNMSSYLKMTQNQAKTREYPQDAASSGIWLKLNVF